MDLSKVSESDHVLDAGCGVGGAALYLAENRNLPVTGITLSEKQLEFSKQNAIKRGLDDKVSFQLMDFTQTSFEDESFDMIWACESVCHTPDRRLFN